MIGLRNEDVASDDRTNMRKMRKIVKGPRLFCRGPFESNCIFCSNLQLCISPGIRAGCLYQEPEHTHPQNNGTPLRNSRAAAGRSGNCRRTTVRHFAKRIRCSSPRLRSADVTFSRRCFPLWSIARRGFLPPRPFRRPEQRSCRLLRPYACGER